jgi:glycerophosphoryl diester phosphodiesterase
MTPIASHRGGAILWPENSLTAFRQALALPVEQLELDVHASADGEAVVIHDATLDRTTDAAGPVRAMPTAALQAVRVKGTGGEHLPMLAEACALLAPTQQALRLEVKADRDGRLYPGLPARCLEVLDTHALRPRTWLMSFQPLALMETPGEGLAGKVLLLESLPWRGMGLRGAAVLARLSGAREIGLPLGEVDTLVVAALRGEGLGIGVWGANSAMQIERALALGVDALTTDDPVTALRLRGRQLPPA